VNEHADVARFLLAETTGTDAEKVARIKDPFGRAQVHAVLAVKESLDRLVEQQRIANLIAWTEGSGYEPTPEITAEIREGLGL